MKILLGRDDVSPNKPDNGGQAPLSWALCSGHEGVVKILVGRDDINFDKPYNGGRTPLSWAAIIAQEEAMKILAGWDGVSPDNLRMVMRETLLSFRSC